MRNVILAALLVAALAADEPTPAQRAACLPDALRFCIRANPDGSGTATRDRAAIAQCMRAHQDQLSRACREAFQ